MAGYSKMYLIGEEGGFQGADGITGIELEILVGESSRQWYEGHYLKNKSNRLANVKRIVPAGPNHTNALIDSCICFLINSFKDCPSFKDVENELKLNKLEMLDFDDGKNIPHFWKQLREEARPIFNNLNIFEASIDKLQ